MNWEEHKLQTRLGNSERATIVPSMSKTSGRKRSKRRGKRSKSSTGRKGKSIRVVKGRVALRVPGYQGVQKFSPSHLIQHVNKRNLRLAAKSVLNRTKSGKKSRRRKRRSQKRKQ
jgi:GH24 family phage-related lysozyme (muramidase)